MTNKLRYFLNDIRITCNILRPFIHQKYRKVMFVLTVRHQIVAVVGWLLSPTGDHLSYTLHFARPITFCILDVEWNIIVNYKINAYSFGNYCFASTRLTDPLQWRLITWPCYCQLHSTLHYENRKWEEEQSGVQKAPNDWSNFMLLEQGGSSWIFGGWIVEGCYKLFWYH